MKKYVKPEMEITEFDAEDVITTSGDEEWQVSEVENETGESSF